MTVQTVEQAPSLPRLFGKAVITARGRHGDRLPEMSLERREVTIDRTNLASYADVCGFRQSDTLPPTYPHLLGFPLAVSLMVDPAFPFPLAGLVHVANRIEQRRRLRADERLSVCVRAENLRDHPKGRQFDMITEVSAGGESVWGETSTYLKRRPSPKKAPSASGGESPSRPGSGYALWRVPRNIGRRYASVSGDINPIHLNPLTARLFGFPRMIAHGMWVKARCLAALEGRLPDALVAQVEFKSPLLLPSTVAFSSQPGEDAWQVAVVNARTGRPHLVGQVETAAR